MQCVGGSREGTDACVRETRFLLLSPLPWQLVALAHILSSGGGGWGVGDGGGVLDLKIVGG